MPRCVCVCVCVSPSVPRVVGQRVTALTPTHSLCGRPPVPLLIGPLQYGSEGMCNVSRCVPPPPPNRWPGGLQETVLHPEGGSGVQNQDQLQGTQVKKQELVRAVVLSDTTLTRPVRPSFHLGLFSWFSSGRLPLDLAAGMDIGRKRVKNGRYRMIFIIKML